MNERIFLNFAKFHFFVWHFQGGLFHIIRSYYLNLGLLIDKQMNILLEKRMNIYEKGICYKLHAFELKFEEKDQPNNFLCDIIFHPFASI